MKKFTSNFLLVVMVLAMTFSMAACGSKTDDSKESTTNDSSQTSQSTSGKSSEYSSVEEYVNSDEIQNALSTLENSLKGSGMSIKISAEDNKMIYTYTYDSTEKADGMAEQLEKAMEAQDSTFQVTADGIKSAVGVDTASVVIEYIDCNGEMIYSKEYTAK